MTKMNLGLRKTGLERFKVKMPRMVELALDEDLLRPSSDD